MAPCRFRASTNLVSQALDAALGGQDNVECVRTTRPRPFRYDFARSRRGGIHDHRLGNRRRFRRGGIPQSPYTCGYGSTLRLPDRIVRGKDSFESRFAELRQSEET